MYYLNDNIAGYYGNYIVFTRKIIVKTGEWFVRSVLVWNMNL